MGDATRFGSRRAAESALLLGALLLPGCVLDDGCDESWEPRARVHVSDAVAVPLLLGLAIADVFDGDCHGGGGHRGGGWRMRARGGRR